jgi:hypothetical protein
MEIYTDEIQFLRDSKSTVNVTCTILRIYSYYLKLLLSAIFFTFVQRLGISDSKQFRQHVFQLNDDL